MKIIKKYIIIIISVVLALILTNKIYGATAKISASKTTAYVGDKVTVNVNINAAAWNLNVSGNGISDSAITGFNMEGVNQATTKSYTLNTSSSGTYTISLKGDISDGVTDVTTDISQSVTVVVKTKQVQKPVTTTKPAPKPTTSTSKPTTNSNKTNNSTKNKNNNVQVSLSNNAFLKEFRINEAGMKPEFSKTSYNYSVTVGENVDKISVTAIAVDKNAKVEISGNTNLIKGDNIVTVKVTAQDKKTVKIYKITVTKVDNPEKSNADLQSIFAEEHTLIPEFSRETFEYNLGNTKENSLKISAFPENEKAKVDIIGNDNLVLGENNIKIIVTSENKENQKTYSLKVIKEAVEANSLIDMEEENRNNENNTLWHTLKENATILLLYLFIWIEFLQVVYLYERLKKAENVDLLNKDNIHEETHMDKEKGIIKRIKIWKRNKDK